MKHTNKQLVDFREALRDRDTVQQSALPSIPSWVNKSPDERYEQVVHFGEWVAKVLFLAIVTVLCAASIWQNYRRTQPEVDEIGACLDRGGKPMVIRDAKGKVLTIGCRMPARWDL